MSLRLNRTFSIIFVWLYLAATLFLRIWFEPQLQGHILISIFIGALFLLFLWALHKVGFLNFKHFLEEQEEADDAAAEAAAAKAAAADEREAKRGR